jgi:hypothetical protein
MADNLVIESPDFDRIRDEAGPATEDAIRLLWYVTNEEIRRRRQTVRDTKECDEVKVHSVSLAANTDNLDIQRATILHLTGGSPFNLTGLSNGLTGRRVVIHNTGAGTITIVHNATSDAANRFHTDTAANKTLATGQSITFLYLNGAWREMNLL